MRKSARPALLLSVTAFTLLLSGCGANSIILQSSPISVPSSQLGKNIKITIEKFDDVRGVKDRVGNGMTGILNFITPIVVNDINDTPKKVLEQAFSNSGFTIADSSSADLILKGRINNLRVSEQTTRRGEHSEAEIEWDIVLIENKTGKKLWYGVKRTSAVSPSTINDTTFQDEKVFNQALEKEVLAILKDTDLLFAIEKFKEDKGL